MSCDTYECVVAHTNESWYSWRAPVDVTLSEISMSDEHVRINESWICECVMTHINASWHIWILHGRMALMKSYCTGWRRLIGSPKLQIIFHKRATKYRSLLQKMAYKDRGSYESSPPCKMILLMSLWGVYIYMHMNASWTCAWTMTHLKVFWHIWMSHGTYE